MQYKKNTHIRAKKSLGQNFLKSKSALTKMISAGSVTDTDTIVEIGPGKGALTRVLLDTGATVVAVEKDETLVTYLHDVFSEEIHTKQLILSTNDILQTTPKTLGLPKKYKVIANIPYYITGEIIRFFLTQKEKPDTMVLLVQKEVAERIVCRDGKESILSLSVKAYGIPKYIQTVSKKYFNPSPKVDSAIIAISHISQNRFKSVSDEELFFTTIKTAFKSKRKKVISNLTPLYTKEALETFFQQKGLDQNARAETISLDTWFDIVAFSKH
jgi:16S rRNA (adenine1518-N6/adenine1519-N6)-dimethyltransferase